MAAQSAQPFRWHYPDLDDKNFELHGRSLFVLLIVFVILLFFTLLCLYVRWACRFPGRWSPSTIPGGTGVPRPGRTNRGSHGLDPKVISSLPVLLYGQVSAAAAAAATAAADGEDSMCSICLSICTEGEKVKILPKCGHTFHLECVNSWLETQSSCPLCRSCIDQVPTIKVSDEIV